MARQINRRKAIHTMGLGAIAASAPAFIHASNKQETIHGQGRHTYELVKDWAKLPKSKTFGYTHGVIVDRQGRIIIFNQSKDAIMIFDADGQLEKSWGEEFQKGAHGLHYSVENGEEFLYLCDYAIPVVVKTTLDGEEIWRLGVPKQSGKYKETKEYRPTNLAVAADGDFYVSDGYGKSWVHHYDKNAKYIRSFGGPGTEPGKMKCPHGIWIDTRGEKESILIADRANVRLQYFNLDGTLQKVVKGDLRYPCDFDQREGDLLIPDLYGRVTIFNKNNQLITHLGDNPDIQKHPKYPNIPHDERIPGKFISPHAARWDGYGNIYVVEWVSDGRVTKLRRVEA